ncbi:polyphosphate--glucose phosphotransferase [Corynebacterium kroppenstedtii]|uniref:polyphosphate--glucose phosphotransferase n=1 Tax=Corynebacterium sp. PCR 32 TaxID=3351342 RepID=UPI0030B4C1F8
MDNYGFGIDIGGSGVKGAVVNLDNGEFVSERIKVVTPQPSTPDAVAETCRLIVDQAQWTGPVGITIPAIVKQQRAQSAANIHKSWIGTDVSDLFHRYLGPYRDIVVLNDADAAGMAEVAYGHSLAHHGSVIFLTFGTGIGSALLINGELFPNSELGHLEINGKEAERRASSAVKDRKGLSYKEWAQRVDAVLKEYEKLFSPTAFIAGGGISRRHEKWIPRLTCETTVIPAKLLNRAGIVGAAMAARDHICP